MTNQEAFDTMVKHLRSLPQRSMAGSSCTYGGDKCAVGALFTEEEQERYGRVDMPVWALLGQMSEEGYTSALHGLDVHMLQYMQDAHDNCPNWGPSGFDNEDELRSIAVYLDLIYTPPPPTV